MKSTDFKILLSIQIITLIFVLVTFFNTLKQDEAPAIEAVNVKDGQNEQSAGGGVTIAAQNNYIYGREDAKNFLMVFSRYNCDYCRYFYNHVIDSLQRDYLQTGKLKVICKDLVGPEDKLGMLMAKVAEVGRQTGRFKEIHKLLMTEPGPGDSVAIIKLAIQAGISETDINERLNSKETLGKIRDDYDESQLLNVTATPSFVLNGKTFIGYMSYTDIVKNLSSSNVK